MIQWLGTISIPNFILLCHVLVNLLQPLLVLTTGMDVARVTSLLYPCIMEAMSVSLYISG